MPDLLRMTASPELLTGATVFLQPLAQVVEIAHIDQVDARFYLYSLTGGTSVTFELLTALDGKSEDDWESLGSLTLLPSGTTVPKFKSTTFPQPILASTTDPPVPLLRYLRWRVTLNGVGATAATIQILAILRRKGL